MLCLSVLFAAYFVNVVRALGVEASSDLQTVQPVLSAPDSEYVVVVVCLSPSGVYVESQLTPSAFVTQSGADCGIR